MPRVRRSVKFLRDILWRDGLRQEWATQIQRPRMVQRTNENVKRDAGCALQTDAGLNLEASRRDLRGASIDAIPAGTYNVRSTIDGTPAGPPRPMTSEERIT